MKEINLIEKSKNALKKSQADQTEILCMKAENSLTRFANNIIHQNNYEDSVFVNVRAVIGKKIGVASCNSLEEKTIEDTVKKAVEFAKLQKENEDFISLPKPTAIKEVNVFDEAVIKVTPKQRAEFVKYASDMAKKHNIECSGTCTTGYSELAIVNTLGVLAYNKSTDAGFLTTFDNGEGTGYCENKSWRLSDVNPEKISKEALETCLINKNQGSIEPGEYEVVLEEEAFATIIGFLGYMGFGAMAFQEKRSFMSDSINKKVADEKITIYDDGFDSNVKQNSFDYEGVAKQKVMLIENGVAKGVVYDTFTANRENKISTGHGLPAPNAYGPMPMNIVVKNGNSMKEDMIKSIKKGILVKKFHYTNVIHPIKTIITGMTRDGIFLIENGKVTKALKNLRFTENILKVLSNVEMISKDRKLIDSSYLIPAVKIKSFAFTGTTDY